MTNYGVIATALLCLLPLSSHAETYKATFMHKTAEDRQFREYAFQLPKECDAMEKFAKQQFQSFDMRRIRQYSSYQSYCSNAELLTSGSEKAEYDYISDYDFTTLPLTLVPSTVHCIGITSNEWHEFCTLVKEQSQDICHPKPCSYPLSYTEFILKDGTDHSWAIDTGYSSIDEPSCRFQNNSFVGKMAIVDDIVKCKQTDDSKRLHLSVIGFRDMDHDGYMDAVLKLTQASEGSGVDGTDTFVLTRFGVKQQLQSVNL